MCLAVGEEGAGFAMQINALSPLSTGINATSITCLCLIDYSWLEHFCSPFLPQFFFVSWCVLSFLYVSLCRCIFVWKCYHYYYYYLDVYECMLPRLAGVPTLLMSCDGVSVVGTWWSIGSDG